MSITSALFKAARISATTRALTSGSPTKIARRGRNIAVGRSIARAGGWNKLWGKW